uniref:Uncharacterized protein n=1 Tax=Panagrolaimus sp. ES5 TaxID=591445 RepID=A0AC34FMV2_9BILA
MSKLNRDILREVFYEIIKGNDDFKRNDGCKDVEKFMMLGREPFDLVLDICKQAEGVVFYKDKIVAQLPNIEYKPLPVDSDYDSDDENYEAPIIGTVFSSRILLIKPISLALATTITTLDLKGFILAYIPMLKSINREMKEVNIQDSDKQLKAILEACVNIPNVQDGVTIRLCSFYDFSEGIKAFAIPCRKLTIKKAYFNTMYRGNNLYNPHLRNIRDLAIEGRFRKTSSIHKELKEFTAFIASNFPNLETLNINFLLKNHRSDYYWNWNDSRMANFFKTLPYGIRGCICFKIVNQELEGINRAKYPDVQENTEGHYKIFPVTNNLSFKLVYWYDVKARQREFEDYAWDSDYS